MTTTHTATAYVKIDELPAACAAIGLHLFDDLPRDALAQRIHHYRTIGAYAADGSRVFLRASKLGRDVLVQADAVRAMLDELAERERAAAITKSQARAGGRKPACASSSADRTDRRPSGSRRPSAEARARALGL